MDVERGMLDIVFQVVLIPEPGGEVPGVGDLRRVVRDEGELALDGAGEPGPGLVDRPVEDVVVGLGERPGVAGARVGARDTVGDVVIVLGECLRAVAARQCGRCAQRQQ